MKVIWFCDDCNLPIHFTVPDDIALLVRAHMAQH